MSLVHLVTFLHKVIRANFYYRLPSIELHGKRDQKMNIHRDYTV